MSKQISVLSQRTVYDKSTKQSLGSADIITSRSYDDTSMQMAIAAVEQQEMTLRRAALCYGIPSSTLHDRISGKVKDGATWGLFLI